MKRFIILFITCMLSISSCGKRQERFLPGLVGAYYGNADLTRINCPRYFPIWTNRGEKIRDMAHPGPEDTRDILLLQRRMISHFI